MLIKEFATKYHVTTDTVRYYEKEGLLTPIRLESGYRFYDETCEKAITFIIVLKQLGFSLAEIRLLLDMESKPISPECNVASTTLFAHKISELEAKVSFFTTAIHSLQIVLSLMEQEKFAENKPKIEGLIKDMYKDIQEKGIE
ncbi:MAG TPA: MerR family transcriptional regulator [Bacillota bacterium]|nr:MerR family transcriptional regulator [Bacillota bacterium]